MKRIPIALLLLSLVGVADASQSKDASASCQQQKKRVAIWPHSSPKAPQFARFEYREVTVCNGVVVAPDRNKRSVSPSA